VHAVGNMARMKRLVLVGLALAAFAPVSAGAAVPCRDRIYNDWYADGKIATTYSAGCYRDALKHVPPDARVYSSLADDIRSAMRGAQARSSGHKGVPEQIGKGIEPAAATIPTKTRPKTTKTTSSHQPPTRMQPVSQAPPTSTLAAADSSSSSSGVPVPLIVLGALALLLIAVGGAGAIAKRRRA
jgi:hypothetical protein